MLRPFVSGSKMAASLRASSVEAVRITKVLFFLPLTVILTDPKRFHAFPTECLVDATGLDGSDLRLPGEADIVVRTDRHGQNVYGPSIFLSGESYHLSSIWTVLQWKSRDCQDFVVSHYFVTDSAHYWD